MTAEPLPVPAPAMTAASKQRAVNAPAFYDSAPALKRSWPRLSAAVQPRELPAAEFRIDPRLMPEGTFNLDGSCISRLSPSPHALCGPISCKGDCLEPMVSSGRKDWWIHPGIEPQDGDLVLIELSKASQREMLALGASDAEWCEKYADGFSTVIGKQLQVFAGQWVMVEKTGAWPLGDNRILGVCRHISEARASSARTSAGSIVWPRIVSNEAFEGGSLIGDPFFSRASSLYSGASAIERHYWRDDSSGTGIATIAAGGVSGGVLQVAGAYVGGPGAVSVSSIPRSRGSQFVTGENVRVNVRVRKRNNPTLTTGLAQVLVGAGDADGVMDVVGTGTTVDLDYTIVNAWTVDQWQEYEASFALVNVAKTDPQKPYCIASIGVALFSHDIELEFDAVNVTRNAA